MTKDNHEFILCSINEVSKLQIGKANGSFMLLLQVCSQMEMWAIVEVIMLFEMRRLVVMENLFLHVLTPTAL